MRREKDAHRALTASVAPAAYVQEVRERRKPATIGERMAAQTAQDVFAERQQLLIEAGLWPLV